MTRYLLVASILALATACGGNGSSNPAQPKLGAVIDRMGRAGVNTAVTNPFDLVSGKSIDQTKDDYNANGDPTTWSQYAPQFAKSLAVLDSLDGTCGNQLLAKPASGATIPADRYLGLAGVLADDQLYVNTGSTTCQVYLGVEANATNAVPNSDCGGRTPLENTIDETYSLLAIGATSGVTNGITMDTDHQASLTAFPFLQPPN